MFNGYAGSGLETTFTHVPAGESATIMGLSIDTDRAGDGPPRSGLIDQASSPPHTTGDTRQPHEHAGRFSWHQRAVLIATSGRKTRGPLTSRSRLTPTAPDR